MSFTSLFESTLYRRVNCCPQFSRTKGAHVETPDTDSRPTMPDVDSLRARVRADQRSTSAPMIAFGVLIVAYAVLGTGWGARLDAGGRHLMLLLFWPLATIAGFLALWLSSRGRAMRSGVGEGRRSYGTATLVALLVLGLVVPFTPLLFVGVFAPMAWVAAVLASLAWWRHDRALGAWAAVIGVLGAAEAVVLVAQRDLGSGWWWLPAVGYGALGLALVVGGVVTARRERRTAA